MKTLSEKIKESCDKANGHTAKANECIKKVLVHSLVKKIGLNCIILFFSLNLSAQSFKSIDCLNMTTNEMMSFTASNFIRFSAGTFEGMICINRFSTDLGLVSYVFNDKNICVKILIPTISKRNYDLAGYYIENIQLGNITSVELLKQ